VSVIKSKHRWTVEELIFIRESYKAHGRKTVIALFAERFGVSLTVPQFKCVVTNYGLQQRTRRGGFQKGNVPPHKGRKGISFPGSVATQFSCGNTARCLPLGAEKVRTHTAGQSYVLVKVGQPNKWALKHRLIWEEANGRKVPEGYRVLFADGNTRNFAPENLILVSPEQVAIMTAKELHFRNGGLTRIGATLAALAIKKSEITKNKTMSKEEVSHA